MTDPRHHIVLSAGGTAGHVFPAAALASEMKLRGWAVSFVTDNRGSALGVMKDVDTYPVRAGGVAGKRITGLIRSLPELAIGTLQARSLLKRLRPDVVIGFGGYASVPTMLAATYGNYKTAIHEQNAILGRANRLMAGRVNAIASSYTACKAIPNDALHKIVHTGMPVRQEVGELCGRPYPALSAHSDIGLFVMGGSQGARVLSDIVPSAVRNLTDDLKRRLKIVQQCRTEDLDAVRTAYAEMDVSADLRTFFDDVPQRLADAHLVIGRSGASSVAEALAMGRPTLLIPYPHATDDHQSANAYAVAADGAGWVMDQSVFTPDVLSARLAELFENVQVLSAAASCAANVGRVDAAVRLADLVQSIVSGNGGATHKQDERAVA